MIKNLEKYFDIIYKIENKKLELLNKNEKNIGYWTEVIVLALT